MNPDWDDFHRACRGDEMAWHRVVDRHRPRLFAMALLICGDADGAADCVQEAFVRLTHSPPRHYEGSLHGFLGTIVYRLALKDLYRRRRQTELDEHVEAETPTPLDSVIRDEKERWVAKAIRALDDDHRQTLLLRFYGGYSYEEIAELMHLPVGTVKSRLFYAVKCCRIFLMEKGITHDTSF